MGGRGLSYWDGEVFDRNIKKRQRINYSVFWFLLIFPPSFLNALICALSLKMREPILSETPQAFRNFPKTVRSGGVGRKGVKGERNSRPALAFPNV